MSFIRSVFQGTSIDFFNNNSSSEVSGKRDYNVTSAVKRPLMWLAALGLLITNAGATKFFAHSENVVDFGRIVRMKTPLQPEFSITKTPEEVECSERVSETLKNIFDCPFSRVLDRLIEKRDINIVCVPEYLPELAIFNSEYNTLLISANFKTQLPEKYMVAILREFSMWLYAEDFIILRKKRCNFLPSEYARLQGKFLDQCEEIVDEMTSSCVKDGYWSEEFISENLAAREVVTKLTSLGEREVILSVIKGNFQGAEIKKLENARGEEFIELAVKYMIRYQKEIVDIERSLNEAMNHAFIEEWYENC